jgi:hypothetical protein
MVFSRSQRLVGNAGFLVPNVSLGISRSQRLVGNFSFPTSRWEFLVPNVSLGMPVCFAKLNKVIILGGVADKNFSRSQRLVGNAGLRSLAILFKL